MKIQKVLQIEEKYWNIMDEIGNWSSTNLYFWSDVIQTGLKASVEPLFCWEIEPHGEPQPPV